MKYDLTVNGKKVQVDVDPDTPLLWVLRDELGITGTKFGCGVAACGACSVQLDGEITRSCSTSVEDASGMSITTIEGLSDNVAKAVQEAWLEKDVVQCGYCQSGQIMNAVSLLRENARPSEQDINDSFSSMACRCATYVRIKEAVQLASKKLESFS